ncbi:MAG: ATP-binding protein [Aristaeellaceae bacterium]
MTKKIFRSILFTSLTVLLLSLAIAVGSLYCYFASMQEQQLDTELTLAAQAVEKDGSGYFDGFHTSALRLTLVGKDGTVLADTDADPAAMENHADREEIMEALASGRGQSARYSATLTERTIYRAVALENGDVLRISVSQATILALIAGILPWFVLAVLFASALSWLLAKRLSQRIITPLNQVDLDHPLENDTYEELSPLLGRIHRQHEQIDTQLLQLRQKTDEFDHITANMKEGLVLLDASGKILSMNPAAMALFGAKTAAVGADFLTVERSHKISHAVDVALQAGHTSIRDERNARSYQLDISRIESAGKVLGLVILAFDVTQQEHAEKTRREFTANVSHELKTPLTSIIASADLIENNLVKPEDMPRFIGHISKEASRLLHLIDDIIRLSQLDEGVEMPEEMVDLSAVAAESVEQLRNTAEQHRVQISLEAEKCVLKGIPRLFHEIVYNLTENAIKYNMPGGSVTVAVRKTADAAVLVVSDTGIGIPPEHQERIFERFYRVDQSHSRQSGGTGLGLSIVKHAASCFDARIDLQSTPGKGTTVTVTFPQ